MSVVHVRNHASTANANPQIVSLAGKTAGRDVWVALYTPATPTVASPWVEHGSKLSFSAGAYLKLWRLPAADNSSGVTQLSVALNGSAPLAAVVWEDTEELDGTVYFAAEGGSPSGADPFLWGTALHTFASKDQTFAVFASCFAAANTPDIASYDQGYTELGDSGWPGSAGSENAHVWVAQNDATAMASNGVTATGGGPVGSYSHPVSGMAAYDTVAGAGKLSIAEENELAGEDAGQVTISGAGDTTNLGFARPFSLNVGETVEFCCGGTGVVIDVYRIGWYGGDGWHLVDTVTNTATTQPAPATVTGSNSSKTCSNWTASAEWDVPAVATPGLYVGVFRNVALNNASYIPFVVRDDDRPADIMVKLSDATWALAYNYFDTMAAPVGGKSFYGSTGPMTGGITNRGHCATYEKPIVTRDGIPQTYWLNAEAPLIRFLERSGYDVTYSACRDWREAPTAPTLAECDIYISSGHDEYWSQGMRDNWEALRDAGKHLLFVSGNEVFWRTRYGDELDEAGSGDELWCFKDTMSGPSSHVAGDPLDPVSWTGTWRDTRWAENEPDNELTGTLFGINGLNALAPVVAANSHPFWRSTTAAGSGATLGAGLVGFEADHMAPTQPEASVTVLASTDFDADGLLSDENGENYDEDGTLEWGVVAQRHESGALVVGFGSCQWAWGLDATHDRGTDVESEDVQQAMYNLFADLGATDPETPISGVTPPSPVSLNGYGEIPGAVVLNARFHLLVGGEWAELNWT